MSKAPLILAAIIMPSCAIIVGGSVFAMTATGSRAGFHEWEVAESYACAYRSGQMGIMNGLPSLFPKKEEMREDIAKSCERFRALAAKHGFNQ